MEPTLRLNTRTIEALTRLIERTELARGTLGAAAARAGRDDLTRLFRLAADEMRRRRDELRVVRSMSVQIEAPGSDAGHPAPDTPSGREASARGDHALLSEAADTCSALLDEYHAATDQSAGGPVSLMLHRHIASIESSRARFRDLVGTSEPK